MVDTKERILHEALLASGTLRFEDISLSYIAKQVGISKTAIFRHYHNKADLLQQLSEYVDNQLDILEEQVASIPAGISSAEYRIVLFQTMAGFFATRRELLPYILHKSFITEAGNKKSLRFFSILGDILNHIGPDRMTLSTMWFFMIQLLCNSDLSEAHITEVGQLVSEVTEHGFAGLDELKTERIQHLQQACSVSLEETQQDRFYHALEQIVLQHGPFGVSVQRMASELGVAPSTLYATFSDKEAMVRETTAKAFSNYMEVVAKRLEDVQTIGEAVFSIIATTVSYCQESKPFMACLVSWVCLNGSLECRFDHIKEFSSQLPPTMAESPCLPEFMAFCRGSKLPPQVLLAWIAFIGANYVFVVTLHPELTLETETPLSMYDRLRAGRSMSSEGESK